MADCSSNFNERRFSIRQRYLRRHVLGETQCWGNCNPSRLEYKRVDIFEDNSVLTWHLHLIYHKTPLLRGLYKPTVLFWIDFLFCTVRCYLHFSFNVLYAVERVTLELDVSVPQPNFLFFAVLGDEGDNFYIIDSGEVDVSISISLVCLHIFR